MRAAVDALWSAQHRHPFVRAIGEGTLDPERFRHWVRQDYRFLIQYGRVFALAAARAPDPELLARFTDLLWSTIRHEMDLHRRLAAELGISAQDLEREEMAPATQAYTDFLLATAAVGDFAELAAALLPCMWAYSEIGHELDQGPRPVDPRLAAW
ncbi:MAG TPA: thiaminase II, partial [Candidatus Nitrosotalea sp.]|nr:thiaminase II [Candidatus Nitrosotalea sp.]